MFSSFAAIPVCGVQYVPFSTEYWVRVNHVIVYGAVVSAELRRAPAEYDTNLVGITAQAFITIKTDKFLLDRTNEFADSITFIDRNVHGCAYPFKSEFYPETRNSVNYKFGERSLFFLYLSEDGMFRINGLLSKFDVIDGDEIQAKRERIVGDEPFQISEFEGDILRYANSQSGL
ncbi:MAG: hypothetical protein ACRENW_00570 [Thermodesulfobacteriota bacterium]